MGYIGIILLFILLVYLICDNIEKSKKIKSVKKIFEKDYDQMETYQKFQEIEKLINRKI